MAFALHTCLKICVNAKAGETHKPQCKRRQNKMGDRYSSSCGTYQNQGPCILPCIRKGWRRNPSGLRIYLLEVEGVAYQDLKFSIRY